MNDASTSRPSRRTDAVRSELIGLLGLAFLSLIAIIFYITASHTITSTHDGLDAWLKRHPPRKVSHDAELLRRQRLAQLIELPPAELAQHVTAILASLEHSDDHVRRLASAMLGRLEKEAVTLHSAAIAELLNHDDAAVRLHAVQALAVASEATLAGLGARIVECLADADPGVRWAAVDTLSGLPAKELAKLAIGAINRLVQAQDLSLAKSAVSSWWSKLETSGPEVTEAIGRLNYQLNFGGQHGMGMA